MLNNTKIQNPNEQNMKAWYNVIVRALSSCHCEESLFILIYRDEAISGGFKFRTFEI